MRVIGWGATDVGRKRNHNEDSFLCNNDIALYAVADGMGGHLGGERASRMAVEILESEIVAVARPASSTRGPPMRRPGRAAPGAVDPAQGRRRGRPPHLRGGAVEPRAGGHGHDADTLLFHGGYVHLGHVGDSRAYLYRDGRARQLSEDHSWIQEQVRAGLISPEEAKESRFRNIITRSVGFEPSVEPDLQGLAVQAGDCFVLCSDGLSNYLTVEELAQVLTGHCYRDVPTVFIDLANERGGDDNVTCLAIYAGNEDA